MHWATALEQLSPLQVVLQQPLKQHSKQVNSLRTCQGDEKGSRRGSREDNGLIRGWTHLR